MLPIGILTMVVVVVVVVVMLPLLVLPAAAAAGGGSVSGSAQPSPEGVSVRGTLTGLEASAAGGVHVHAGWTVAGAGAVGGHFWETGGADPWTGLQTGWTSDAWGAAAVDFSAANFTLRAFQPVREKHARLKKKREREKKRRVDDNDDDGKKKRWPRGLRLFKDSSPGNAMKSSSPWREGICKVPPWHSLPFCRSAAAADLCYCCAAATPPFR